MEHFIPNRHCCCRRCRYRGLMGPVVLVTIGVLFLLSTFDIWHFGRSWPILLIAIGVVQVLSSTADTSGHVRPSLPDIFAHGCAPFSPPPQNPPQSAPGSPASGQQSSQGVDHV